MEQAEFLLNVCTLIQSMPAGYAPGDFLDALREHLPPGHPNVLKFTPFHKRLRDYLSETAKVPVHRMEVGKDRRIDIQLARTIYDGEDYNEEHQIALNLIKAHKHWDPSRSPTAPGLSQHAPGAPSPAMDFVLNDFRSPTPGLNFFDQ